MDRHRNAGNTEKASVTVILEDVGEAEEFCTSEETHSPNPP